MNPANPPWEPPEYFLRFISGTEWSSGLNSPILPLTVQQWAATQGLDITTSAIPLYAMIFGGIRTIPSTGGAGTDVWSFYFIHKWWTILAASAPTKVEAEHYGVGDQELPTQTSDWIIFDEHTISRLLKVKFLQAKGLDSTAATAEYKDALEAAKSSFTAGTLSLAKTGGFRFIDASNAPDTGYGS
jgi:hypothetical protein